MRSLLLDLGSSTPPLVTTVVAGAIPLIVFAVLCSVFVGLLQGSVDHRCCCIAPTPLSLAQTQAGFGHRSTAQAARRTLNRSPE